MSTIVISALWTQGGGDPATGLALADIDLYLFSRNRSTGVVAPIWVAVNPTEEIGGGLYSRSYATADEDTYGYFAYAQYMGVAVLDNDYSLMGSPSVPDCCTKDPGCVEFTYTVTNSLTGLPLPGVFVWVVLASNPAVVLWNGLTDVAGVARDLSGDLPCLMPATYRFFKSLIGFSDSDAPFDVEIVS